MEVKPLPARNRPETSDANARRHLPQISPDLIPESSDQLYCQQHRSRRPVCDFLRQALTAPSLFSLKTRRTPT
jgi:hypothetical protein